MEKYNTEGLKTKVCYRCKKEKPLTLEFFGRNKGNKDGFNGTCKVCRSEYLREYRRENKEKIKRYREENKEYYREYNRQYYRDNRDYFKNYVEKNKEHRRKLYESRREEIVQYHRTYYRENKKDIQEQKREYYEKNKHWILRHNSKYRKSNRDRLNKAQQRRRALKRGLPRTLAVEQWSKIRTHFNNSCSYCGMDEEKHKEIYNEILHQDHFIPLSMGGEYTHNNIIPACRRCNSSKNDRTFFEWYPTYEFYCRDRERKILDFLGYTGEVQQLSIL